MITRKVIKYTCPTVKTQDIIEASYLRDNGCELIDMQIIQGEGQKPAIEMTFRGTFVKGIKERFQTESLKRITPDGREGWNVHPFFLRYLLEKMTLFTSEKRVKRFRENLIGKDIAYEDYEEIPEEGRWQ